MGAPFKSHVCLVIADEIMSQAGLGPVKGNV